MGTKPDNGAAAADKKPFVRDDGKNIRGHCFNDGARIQKKEKFVGACADLHGHVFEASGSRVNKVANFTITMEKIKIYMGQKFDPIILECIEKMQDVIVPEPQPSLQDDGTMTEVDKIKYGKMLDRWLTAQDRINKEKKQAYAVIYGQCDEDMKASLLENSDWQVVHKNKDLVQFLELLQQVNFSYRSNQEPFLTMFNAKADFFKFKQQKHM